MKNQLATLLLLFYGGTTAISCNDNGADIPVKNELLSFTLKVDNVGFQGAIHPETNEVTVGTIEYASTITGVSCKLSKGSTISPLPETLLGKWRREETFYVTSQGGDKVTYKVILTKYKGDKPADIAPEKPEGKVIFEDHFDQSSREPNSAKWSLCPRITPPWGRYLSESYDQAYVENGKLILKAEKVGDTYKTGGIQTLGKVEFMHGKVEVCAKFTKTAQGGWPAIWMMPASSDGGGWPTCGEIDIMEQLNHDKFVYHTIHSHYKNDLGHTTPNPTVTTAYNADAFNVYAIEWTAESIIFLVNGKPALTYPNLHLKDEATMKQWPFNRPFYLILNYAVGGVGTWPGEITENQLPAMMEVDWVRVTQK